MVKATKKTGIKKNNVIIFAITTIFCSCIFLFYRNNKKKIKIYKQEIRKLEEQLQIIIKTKKTNKKMENTIHFLKNQLKTPKTNLIFQDATQSEQQMPNIVQYIQMLGLQLNSCVTQKTKDKQWFNKQNVVYCVTGTPEKIGLFIQKIQNDERSLKCKNIIFNRIEENKAHLECTLQFLTFKPKFKSN